MKGKLITLVLSALIVSGLVTATLVAWLLLQEPNPHGQGYVADQAQRHFSNTHEGVIPGEDYKIVAVEVSGLDPDWSLVTIARINPDLPDKTGSAGLIAIGMLKNKRWQFRIIGETGFDEWLDQLPADLLSPEQKNHFGTPAAAMTQNQFRPKSDRLQTQVEYNLPYPEGDSYVVTTLPGEAHHTGAIEHSIDFGMPEFSSVAAVTSGRVVGVRQDSTVGGCSPAYANAANFVRIRTSGSSETILYLHLAPHTAKVSEGDEVKAGQIIGRSGSTGFTCNWTGTGPGPHLHLVRERWCGQVICGSIPLRFAEFTGKDPVRGFAYTSSNLSPADRERKAQQEEARRQLQEKAEIEKALDMFHAVYTCSILVECDESTLITNHLTVGMMEELFPNILFCFGCQDAKWDENSLEQEIIQPYQVPAPNQTEVTVTSEQTWVGKKDGHIYTQNTVVDHFLVKEGAIWKVDGYDIISCEYSVERRGDSRPRTTSDCILVSTTGSEDE